MSPKESSSVGIFFLLFIVAGIGFTLWELNHHHEWWLPPLVSEHGALIDKLFIITLVITGVLFVLSELALAFFVIRYKGDESRKAHYLPGLTKKSVFWSITPGVVVILLLEVSLGVMGGTLWGKYTGAPPENSFTVDLCAQQFAWNIRYPGKDGKFGSIDPKFFSNDNPVGLDLSDPNAKDDIVTMGDLEIPVNRPVHLMIRSRDVLHSPFLPYFRIKMDAVPGMYTNVWFVPTKTGEYELACAELCGLGHYKMRGVVTVLPQKELDKWLDEQTPMAEYQ